MSGNPPRPVWPRSPRAAMALQRRLRERLIIGGRPRRVRTVAGADIAYDNRSGVLHAAVLVYSFPDLDLIETRRVTGAIGFPYVPGLLSFREAPALLRACRALRERPDLLICDGQGIAHPRGVGLASHLGLLLDLPTIGCAKSRLIGEHRTVPARRGASVPLTHRGAIVGRVVRTRGGVKPLYVSPGHLIGVAAAVDFVLDCGRGFRLPEPVRQADRLVGAERRLAASTGSRSPGPRRSL